ncbi:MAG: Trk system potassium transporter TrkA [Clostridia bacterium]|nr:Trk system potassium transporter TrkA [Clostridia bacterium]
MKVIISGCGNVGTAILEGLLKDGHDIVVIDTDHKTIELAVNNYDVLGVCGNGTSYEILSEAGAIDADLFISVTGSDEFNMLSCFVAKQMGANHTVARIRNPEYNNPAFEFVKKQLGISMVLNPEMLTAKWLYNVLQVPSASSVEKFSSSDMDMIELLLKDGSPVLGVPLYELRKKLPLNFLICVVQRGEEAHIPNGSFVLQSGDKVGVLTLRSELHKLAKAFGIEKKPAKSVIIVGASKIAYYLSTLLLHAKTSVKLIDKNPEKCLEFAEKLAGATIVNGDGMSQELLLEEGVLSADAFLSLTNKDEENVLMSIYSQSKNVQKTITKINRDELIDISDNLGLDTVVTAKHVVADALVRYARALENSKGSKIETLYSLLSGSAEASEFEVLKDFKYSGVCLKDLKLKSNVLIAGIIRDRHVIIPCGDDFITAGDKVIVITAGESLFDLVDVIK